MSELLAVSFRPAEADANSERAWRLVVEADPNVYNDADKTERNFDYITGKLAKAGIMEHCVETDTGRRFIAIGGEVIGNVTKTGGKAARLDDINDVLCWLVAAANRAADPETGDPDPGIVRPVRYGTTGWVDGFDIEVRLRLAEGYAERGKALAAAAVARMQLVARTMNYLPAGPPDSISAEVHSERGVGLGFGPDSSLHTLGEYFHGGDQIVGLYGNNVREPLHPLVFLAGATALVEIPTPQPVATA